MRVFLCFNFICLNISNIYHNNNGECMTNILSVLFRTIFFYFFTLIMLRIMGKREIAQLGVIDFVVSILVAELIAISIENTNDPIWNTIIPIAAVTSLEVGLAYLSLKSKKFRTIFDGKPSIIIEGGKLNYKEMVKQRYTIDDLLFELRQRGIKSLENVDYALLEANGKLSIFEKKIFDKVVPLPLIVDGEIQLSTLKKIGKSKYWLDYMIRKHNLNIDEVFYCFYKGHTLFIIKDNDLICSS